MFNSAGDTIEAPIVTVNVMSERTHDIAYPGPTLAKPTLIMWYGWAMVTFSLAPSVWVVKVMCTCHVSVRMDYLLCFRLSRDVTNILCKLKKALIS